MSNIRKNVKKQLKYTFYSYMTLFKAYMTERIMNKVPL